MRPLLFRLVPRLHRRRRGPCAQAYGPPGRRLRLAGPLTLTLELVRAGTIDSQHATELSCCCR